MEENRVPPELRESSQQRWDQNEKGTSRPARQYCEELIHQGGDYTYGYTIYRTVFTPESDDKFAQVVNIIEQNVRAECFEDIEHYGDMNEAPSYEDNAPNVQIWQRYRSEILSDQELNEASMETIVDRHQSMTEGQPGTPTPRDRFCILIDSEVLDLITQFPCPIPTSGVQEAWEHLAVKVIDVYEEESDEGWAWSPLSSLMDLWFFGSESGSGEWITFAEDDGRPIYSGAVN